MTSSTHDDLAWLSPRIYGHTHVVGVIGWPVEHSVSPPMHNAAFRALGLDWCYVPLPVHPDRIGDALPGLRALGLKGINATVPHKQSLVKLVDELTPAARAIGAVNTVVVRDDGFLGHNTDASGFLRALREAGFSPEGCRALVLGAGGAARAVVYALAEAGGRVTILNRTAERALRLASEFAQVNNRASRVGGPLNPQAACEASAQVDLVVNTTPLGMWPRVDASPWPREVAFPPDALVYDLVYNPLETRIMGMARAAGGLAVDGLGMLVHQGAEAFALWTGQEPPVDVMYRACIAVLGGE